MAKSKRKILSAEEKVHKSLQALFILNAAQLQMSGGEIRKILGVNMNEVTPILKAVNIALSKKRKQQEN